MWDWFKLDTDTPVLTLMTGCISGLAQWS